MASAKVNMKRTLDYNDLLHPDNAGKFNSIPADVWGDLNAQAQEQLNIQSEYIAAKVAADRHNSSQAVLEGREKKAKTPENVGEPAYLVEHWRSIRKGVVPFGLSVEDVPTGSARVKVEEDEAPAAG